MFWCYGDKRNVSSALPGRLQTNYRAELYAVTLVLETCPGQINIHTDSQYVFDGCTRYLPSWKATGWKIDNLDLWQRLDKALADRAGLGNFFTKVKGHAKLSDVKAGIVSQEDRLGNHEADSLATAGAKLHVMDQASVTEAKCRTKLARSVQNMMADILARNQKRVGPNMEETIDLTGESDEEQAEEEEEAEFVAECICIQDSSDGEAL